MNVQNEFHPLRSFLGNELPDAVILTNVPPTHDHAYFLRTGGFFQWTMRNVPMSHKWDLKSRAMAARQMAMLVFAHWEAAGRPVTLNVGRAVTTKDSNKVLWFLDI